jgi:predicted acyl esterase
MIPMRDGAELAAFVRRPAPPADEVPTILIFTPYDKENARDLWFADPTGEPLFESPDYAFVVADWRGRFGSSAAPLRDNEQHGEDGHDIVEWIADQPWSDGAVGMWGASALGRVQYWTATERPPHLAAAVPIFAHMNQYYENYYPGGVLRREYVASLGVLFGDNTVLEDHPYRDWLWKIAEGLYEPELIEVPLLVVSGWYDLYDPDDPSPTVGGQTLSWSYLHGPTDQAEVLERDDAAVFTTDPLATPLVIAGRIEVHLAVRTTGLDTDFAVRLTDVDHEGRHLLLTDGIRRLKLRDDYARLSEVVPGERYTVSVTLTNDLAYTFAVGHRVGIVITSSNYQRFDRNPNTGDDFYSDGVTPTTVTNTLIMDGTSRLVLPLSISDRQAPRHPSGRHPPDRPRRVDLSR